MPNIIQTAPLTQVIVAVGTTPPLSGDATGPIGSNTVVRLQGRDISSTAPVANQVLSWNGSQWVPTTMSLTLAGDVTGTLGANTVVHMTGQTIAGLTVTTTNGYVGANEAGAGAIRLGAWTSGASYGALYIGVTPSAGNYALTSEGSSVWLNAPNAAGIINLNVAGDSVARFAATAGSSFATKATGVGASAHQMLVSQDFEIRGRNSADNNNVGLLYWYGISNTLYIGSYSVSATILANLYCITSSSQYYNAGGVTVLKLDGNNGWNQSFGVDASHAGMWSMSWAGDAANKHALYFGSNATVPATNNYSFLGDQTSVWFNAPNAAGYLNFYAANTTQIAQGDTTSFRFYTANTPGNGPQIEAAHGHIVAGGIGGTNFKAHAGPLPTFETAFAGFWGLAPGTARSSSNALFYSDGVSSYFNIPHASGIAYVTWQGAVVLSAANQSLWQFYDATLSGNGPQIEALHGHIVAGGTGGTNWKTHIGPYTGFETSNAAIWFLAPGTARSSANMAIYGNGTQTILNSPTAGAFIGFYGGGDGYYLGQLDSTSFRVMRSGGYTSATIEGAHGHVVAGGGNSDQKVHIGPRTGSETTYGALWVLPAATARTANNPVVFSDGSDLYLNSTVAGRGVYIYEAGTTQLASFLAASIGIGVGNVADVSIRGTSTVSVRGDTSVTLGYTASTIIHQGALRFTTRAVSGNITIDTTTTDFILHVDTAAARSITLPAPTDGRVLIIKDKTGSAATNNITIVRHASEKIEGVAASYVIDTDWGWVQLTSDGTDWYVYR